MRNKEKEKAPILYERYKRKHPEPGSAPAEKEEPDGGGFLKAAGSFVITGILLFMTALSIIGVTTLLQPELRELLIEVIGRGV